MTHPVILDRNIKLPSANRLVVLLPEYPVDLSFLGRLIRDLANHRVSNVLLLSVVKEPFAGVHMANVLGYLYAMTHDPFLHVETSVQADTTWMRAIHNACRPGDLFLCLSDHKVPWHIFWHKPIAELITDQLGAPVYVVTVQNGLHTRAQASSEIGVK
jgi:hypothetical protein